MTRSKTHERWFRVGASLAMAAAVGCLSGCLVSSSSYTDYSGSYVSYAELSQLKKGESTEQFVLATLGPPTGKTVESDGSSIWEYSWNEVKERETAVFLVLATESSSRREGAAFVEIRDGIVVDYWRK